MELFREIVIWTFGMAACLFLIAALIEHFIHDLEIACWFFGWAMIWLTVCGAAFFILLIGKVVM